jgi:hypothetical protein
MFLVFLLLLGFVFTFAFAAAGFIGLMFLLLSLARV